MKQTNKPILKFVIWWNSKQ